MIAAQSLYAAEAGLTEGLHRMSFRSESTVYVGPSGLPFAGWGSYIVIRPGASALDPDLPLLQMDGMDNDGDATIDEAGERYPEVLTKQTVDANALSYPYVRVEFKTQGGQLVRFGDADQNPGTPPAENLTKGPPVLRLTARGSQGTAAKTLEAEAVRFPLVDVASPLWAGGKMGFNGNAFLIDGHDHFATAPFDTIPGAPPTPGILTEGPPTDITLALNQEDNVLGDGGDGSVEQSTLTYDFNQIWAQHTAKADYSFTGPITFTSATPTYGTLLDPKVTVVNGNLDCNGTWRGAGVLVVNGNLAMGGGSQFKGIVVVLGDVKLAGAGPADLAHIVGGLIFQGTVVDGSTTGGAASLFYSSQAVNAAQMVNRYSISWWRER